MKESYLLSQVGGESVVQQVINKITDAIVSGELKPGDRLPPELELIEAMHVSRNTLRAAVQTLRAYGVLEVRRPEGTFVCESFSPQMINPAIYRVILAKQDTQELVGLRKILDMGISKLVIQQGLSEERRAELETLYEELVRELVAEKPNLETIAQADLRFHDGIARATDNELAVTLNNVLQDLTTGSRLRSIHRIYDNNDREYLVRVHRMHLDALEKKPGITIEEALDYSYLYWKDSFNLAK